MKMTLDVDVFGKEKRFKKADAAFAARKDENAKLIRSYVDSKRIHISPRRLLEYYLKLGVMDTVLKGQRFKDLTNEGVLVLIEKMRARPGRHGKMCVRSLNNYKKELKSFLKFLGKYEVAESIKLDRMDELNNLSPEDMLDNNDIEALIRAASGERNKAIIAVYSEAGLRPSELFNLQIKDVNLGSQKTSLTVFGKKAKRVRPILGCIRYLVAWLNVHPRANDQEAPLFVKKSGKPLPYPGMLKVVKQTFARAGIKKPAIPKIFRHSSGTYVYGAFPQEVATNLMGHKPGSPMAKHYVHMSAKRVSDAYSTSYGMKPQEEAKAVLMPKTCVVCGVVNAPDKIFCENEKCMRPLSLKSAMEITTPSKLISDVLSTDNQFVAQLEEKLVQNIMAKVEERLSMEIRTFGKNGPEEI